MPAREESVLTAPAQPAAHGGGHGQVCGSEAVSAVDAAVAAVRTALDQLAEAIAANQSAAAMPRAVSGIAAVERVAALLEARRHQLVLEFVGAEPQTLSHRTPGGRDTRIGDIRAVELGALLGTGPDRARTMAIRARTMCLELPDVMHALDSGVLSGYQSTIALDGWGELDRRWQAADQPMPGDTATHFQSRILARATTSTVSEFRRRVRLAVAALAPTGVDTTHHAERDQRDVTLTPAPGGMAWLTAYLEAAQAASVMQVLQHAARHDTTLTGTRDQRAADALVAIVTGQSDLGPASRSAAAEVQLLVSAEFLAGGVLAGQIVGTDLIVEGSPLRELLADARFRRLLVDGDGRLQDFGRTTYRPPVALADHIVARDRSCRAPGCSRPARYTDLDHITSWKHGGPTAAHNLAALCRTHHVLKTHGGWTYQISGDGTAQWQLPGGARASRAPADYCDHLPDPSPPDDPPF